MRRTAAAAAALALALPAPALAYQLEHDDSGQHIRWAQGFTLYVDASSRDVHRDDVVQAVQRAAARWSAAAAVSIDVQVEEGHGKKGYDSNASDNRSEVIFVDDEWEGDDSVVATTLVTTDEDTHTILDADILVNEAQHHFAILPDDSKPGQGLEQDLEATLTHELGHALGLAHNADLPEATMFPSTQPGEISKRNLASDDVQGVQSLYGTPSAPIDGAPSTGCSSGVGGDGALALFAALLIAASRKLRRAKAVAAGLCLVAPVLAGAAPRIEARVEGEVVTTHSYWREGRIYTDVEVAVARCDAASCPTRVTFRQPGGRVGHISQQLGDLEVPPAGAQVSVSLARARDGALRLVPNHRAR